MGDLDKKPGLPRSRTRTGCCWEARAIPLSGSDWLAARLHGAYG